MYIYLYILLPALHGAALSDKEPLSLTPLHLTMEFSGRSSAMPHDGHVPDGVHGGLLSQRWDWQGRPRSLSAAVHALPSWAEQEAHWRPARKATLPPCAGRVLCGRRRGSVYAPREKPPAPVYAIGCPLESSILPADSGRLLWNCTRRPPLKGIVLSPPSAYTANFAVPATGTPAAEDGEFISTCTH